MKRGLNIYEALFLALLFAKATETQLFGHVPSWLIVFLPFVLAFLADMLDTYAKSKQIGPRLRYFIWRIGALNMAKKAGKKASKDMEQYLKQKSSNPGQAYDTK